MWRNEQRYSTSTVPLYAWLLASGCREKRSDQIQVHVAEAKARDSNCRMDGGGGGAVLFPSSYKKHTIKGKIVFIFYYNSWNYDFE